MRVVIYCRVSSDGQEDNTSLDSQLGDCGAWCAAKGHVIVKAVRETISGTTMPSVRPGLKSAMEALQAGEADAILAWKRNRFARSLAAQVALEHFVAEECAGGKLLSLDASDGDNPEDKMMRHILDIFSEYERDMIALRMGMGRIKTRAAGGYIGGATPYGLAAACSICGEGWPCGKPRHRDDGHGLTVAGDASEVAAVKLVFEENDVRRSTIGRIRNVLNAYGMTRRNGGPWTSDHVKSVIGLRADYERVGIVAAKPTAEVAA